MTGARALARTTADVPRPEDTVSLLAYDPDFAACIPSGDLALARRFLVAPRRQLAVGTWGADHLAGDGPRPFAALLLQGLIVQEVLLGGRASAQLVGPGDLIRPWQQGDTVLPCSMRWTCPERTTVAILGEPFLAAARRWPQLINVVHARLSDQLDDAARRTAISGLARVEDRVLALFWQLADSWGIVTQDGVVIRLKLTHELIGRLVAAKRPTVSLALASLAADGHLLRAVSGAWTLSHDSMQLLESSEPQAACTAPVESQIGLTAA